MRCNTGKFCENEPVIEETLNPYAISNKTDTKCVIELKVINVALSIPHRKNAILLRTWLPSKTEKNMWLIEVECVIRIGEETCEKEHRSLNKNIWLIEVECVIRIGKQICKRNVFKAFSSWGETMRYFVLLLFKRTLEIFSQLWDFQRTTKTIRLRDWKTQNSLSILKTQVC
jgi:hypothetical protein